MAHNSHLGQVLEQHARQSARREEGRVLDQGKACCLLGEGCSYFHWLVQSNKAYSSFINLAFLRALLAQQRVCPECVFVLRYLLDVTNIRLLSLRVYDPN